MREKPLFLKSFALRFHVLFMALLLSLGATGAAAQIKRVPQEIAPIQAPFSMPQLKRQEFPDRNFDIRDFGAQPAGSGEMVTDAIHRAIVAANEAGGGRVVIPEGEWLTGPVHMMSHVNLHIAKGATLLFSENREDYLPVVPQRHEGVEAYNYSPMIYASHVENVAITGKGTLNAQGDHWWEWFEEHGAPPRALAAQVPLSRRDFGKGAGNEGMRPSFVLFWKSSGILVEGITLIDTPMWNIHLTYSDNIIVRDVTVDSLRAPNGDGVVIDSSRNVLIEYNHFQTGDDAVVLKSGLNEDGLAIDIPTENVVIRHFEARNVRTGSGGVVFGSETSGGIRNVYVYDAFFDGADRGIRFKTERGRGNVVENIWVRDVRMQNITYEAINFNTFYTGPGVTGPSPAMRNVWISDVSIDGVPTAINLVGLPEKWLENIHLENIRVKNAKQGARLARVKDLVLKNVEINSEETALVATDVYEVRLEEVTLRDNAEGAPLVLQGAYTGAIFAPNFPVDQIQLKDGLSQDIINPERDPQAW